MQTLLLLIHVVLALITLVSSTKVVVDVRRRDIAKSKRGVVVMWTSFATVTASGVGLIVVTPASLGHACALMSLYVMIVSGVQLYQRRAMSLA
jgi:hypothetical protein